jgi:hemoglobin-like flavoprotein
MNPADIQLIRNGFALIVADRDGFAATFYDRLFARHPGLRALFATDMKTQGAKVLAALGQVVKSLDRFEAVVEQLRGLARRHVAYGVERAHYDLVGAALIEALAARLGEAFDERARAAWSCAYGAIAGAMIEASGYDRLEQDAA